MKFCRVYSTCYPPKPVKNLKTEFDQINKRWLRKDGTKVILKTPPSGTFVFMTGNWRPFSVADPGTTSFICLLASLAVIQPRKPNQTSKQLIEPFVTGEGALTTPMENFWGCCLSKASNGETQMNPQAPCPCFGKTYWCDTRRAVTFTLIIIFPQTPESSFCLSRHMPCIFTWVEN